MDPKLVEYHCAPCPNCGKQSTLLLEVDRLLKWQRGMYVQDVFPDLTPDQRELLLTGIDSKCWEKMFGEEE